MIREGTEIVVGLHEDLHFGPVVMLGLGGIFVEVLFRSAFRAAPLTRGDAQQMLRELRGRKILEEVRGQPPADAESVIEVLLAVSRLGVDAAGEVTELDINPLLVLPKGGGAVAVDALAILAEEEASK